MRDKHCSDCGETNSTVKDRSRTRKVGNSRVTSTRPVCDSCYRDWKHRKFLKRNSA